MAAVQNIFDTAEFTEAIPPPVYEEPAPISHEEPKPRWLQRDELTDVKSVEDMLSLE